MLKTDFGKGVLVESMELNTNTNITDFHDIIFLGMFHPRIVFYAHFQAQ